MVAQFSLLQIEVGSPQVYRMSASGGGASPVGGRGSAQISSDGKTLVMINGNNNVVKQDSHKR